VSKAEQQLKEADDKLMKAVNAYHDMHARIRTLRKKSGTQAKLAKANSEKERARIAKHVTDQEKERKVEALRKAKVEVRNLDKAV
jgi:hypothetical protein